ncbi:MAG: c-type cytochrome [Pirellulales bacterium]
MAKTIPLLSVDSKTKSALQASEELLARNKGYGGKIAETLAKLPDAQQMHYAFALRNVKEGWTPDERKTYFQWFDKAHQWSGGNSYAKFLANIEKDAFNNASPADQKLIDNLGLRKPVQTAALPKAKGPGKDYSLDDLLKLSEKKPAGRNFKNGQTMFAAARCVVCHRFGGEGGATGPDLTQLAGRFNLKDLSEAIVDPSKVISDQYKATIVETADGKTYTGRIVGLDDKIMKISTDPEDGTKNHDDPAEGRRVEGRIQRLDHAEGSFEIAEPERGPRFAGIPAVARRSESRAVSEVILRRSRLSRLNTACERCSGFDVH